MCVATVTDNRHKLEHVNSSQILRKVGIFLYHVACQISGQATMRKLGNLHPWGYSELFWTWSWVTCSNETCFKQEGKLEIQSCWRESAKGCQDDEGTRASPWGQAKRAGTVQHRRLREDLIHVYKYLQGGRKRQSQGSVQWWPVPGQETTGTNCNTGGVPLGNTFCEGD